MWGLLACVVGAYAEGRSDSRPKGGSLRETDYIIRCGALPPESSLVIHESKTCTTVHKNIHSSIKLPLPT
jgi:hypothetical protein